MGRYRELGYDFLAITDHDDRVADSYWFQIPAGDDHMIVFPGIELDYRPLSQHVGKVLGDRETLFVLNHPARYNLSVGDVLARIGVLAAAVTLGSGKSAVAARLRRDSRRRSVRPTTTGACSAR